MTLRSSRRPVVEASLGIQTNMSLQPWDEGRLRSDQETCLQGRRDKSRSDSERERDEYGRTLGQGTGHPYPEGSEPCLTSLAECQELREPFRRTLGRANQHSETGAR